MPIFTVEGPFKVPTYAGKAAKIIDTDAITTFWQQYADLSSARGCYAFCIRAGKGIRPIYVGKATTEFRREVFQPHKLAKYQQCLADIKRGTPVLFFLCHPRSKGKPNKKAISNLEVFLIQTAVARNPELLNVLGTKEADWGIGGVLRGGKGKASKSANAFRRAMGLHRA